MTRWTELFDNQESGKAIGFVSGIREDKFGCVLFVSDKDRTINLRIWNVQKHEISQTLENFVIWDFDYSKYNDKYKSMVIEDIDLVGLKTIENDKDFFDSIFKKVDSQLYLNKIREIINFNIEDDNLKSVLEDILDTYREDFLNQRASTQYHHSYKGGLIFHTWQVMEIALNNSRQFKDVHLDIILAGAFMHDLGKLFSYDENGSITEKERKIGYHIVGSLEIAYKFLKDIDYIDDIIHIITSHHGCKEWGALVSPNTLEATIVFTADMLSSHGEYQLLE
jgi:3'-5' exoribonuclease